MIPIIKGTDWIQVIPIGYLWRNITHHNWSIYLRLFLRLWDRNLS